MCASHYRNGADYKTIRRTKYDEEQPQVLQPVSWIEDYTLPVGYAYLAQVGSEVVRLDISAVHPYRVVIAMHLGRIRAVPKEEAPNTLRTLITTIDEGMGVGL